MLRLPLPQEVVARTSKLPDTPVRMYAADHRRRTDLSLVEGYPHCCLNRGQCEKRVPSEVAAHHPSIPKHLLNLLQHAWRCVALCPATEVAKS